MEHLPKLEHLNREDSNRRSDLAVRMERRMERGNLSLLLATLLPFFCLVFLPKLSVIALAGFVLFEVALVAGVAWGTKQFYRLYSLPGCFYHSRTHYLFPFLYGMAAAAMVLFPSMGFVVVLIWCGILVGNLLLRMLRREREQIWQEMMIEFAMAVRVAYPLCLAVWLILAVVTAVVLQIGGV